MTPRDDKEALAARVEALEAENARLRGDVSPDAPATRPALWPYLVVGLLVSVVMSVALVSSTSKRRRRAPVTTTPVAASWRARVLEAEGAPVAPGAACVINSAGSTTSEGSTFLNVTVRCGEHELFSTAEYRRQIKSGGTTTLEMPRLGGPGESGYRLLYDQSPFAVSPYPRVSIDTARRSALVLREMTPRLRVTLEVDPQSQPPAP